jgi:hypothetical protein
MVNVAEVVVVLEVSEVRLDGGSMVISVLSVAASLTTLALISAKASVAEVTTKDSPDGKSVAASLAVLAITLAIRGSEAFVTTVSLSALDPVWKSTLIGSPGEDSTFLELVE